MGHLSFGAALRATVGILFLAASATPALPDNVSLAGLRCEDPEILKIVDESVRNVRLSENGAPLASYVTIGKVTKATTVAATSSKLACKMRVSVTTAEGTTTWRGRITFLVSGKGLVVGELTLGY